MRLFFARYEWLPLWRADSLLSVLSRKANQLEARKKETKEVKIKPNCGT